MNKFLKLEGINYLSNFYRYKLYNENNLDYLLTTDTGEFLFLNNSALKQLKKGKIEDKDLYEKLLNKSIIIDENNFNNILDKIRKKYSFLENGTSLHIIIPTHRCNLACTYCFASAKKIDDDKEEFDLDEKTAKKIVEFILKSPSPAITMEFQGGEAIANIPIIKVMVIYAKKLNEIYQKDLRFTVVSNLTLMNKNIANWLIDNDVSICTSLDGPKYVHDKNRYIHAKNELKVGTYDSVISNINMINNLYKEKKKNMQVNAIPTITMHSINYPKEIIDEYLKLNLKIIGLRPITKVGRIIDDSHQDIIIPHKRFEEFYKESLDYIEELNKKGIKIEEITKKLYEKKILELKPGYHTDFENPCGAITGQITYHNDGNIYTCNEGLGREEFKVGNVFKDKWNDLFNRKESQKAILNSMIESNVKCDRCVFKPYCGTCMVENYYNFGKFNFYPTNTQKHYTTIKQSKKIFDDIYKNILKNI